MKIIRTYPLACFVLFAYLFSWTIWLPLYLPRLGGPSLPVLPLNHALGGLGPLLAAFLVTWVIHRRPGISDLWQRMLQWRVGIQWHLIAWLSPFALFLLAALIVYFGGKPFPTLAGWGVSEELPQFGPIAFALYNILFFGYGEETGWRGFALPRLQARWNALGSALFLNLIWAGWHAPLFLYRPGYTGMDIAGVAGWLVSLVTGSILLSWLYNSSKGSILVVSIFHATVDIAFLSAATKGEMTNYLGMLITIWALVIPFIAKPANLSKDKRQMA